jgi:hypothetical protein
VSARSASTRIQVCVSEAQIACVLISTGVQLGTGAVQGVRRPSEVQGCELEQLLKDCYCRCAQSQKDSST